MPKAAKLTMLKELMIVVEEFRGLRDVALFCNNHMASILQQAETMSELMHQFCSLIVQVASLTTVPKYPRYVRAALSYISENYMTDLSLKHVAEQIHVNPWHLSTQFKKALQINFTEYINKVRIEHSKRLLEQEDLKVYEIAELTGFNDATYFCMVFKKLEGLSPTDYRKIRWCK